MSIYRLCRNPRCEHKSTTIDVTVEDFKKIGNKYYHTDCYEVAKNGNWKTDKEKSDIKEIITYWHDNIDKNVSYSQLTNVLNSFIKSGIKSDYLLFAIRFVNEHNLGLRYPGGIKYFINKQTVKAAYNNKSVIEDITVEHFETKRFSKNKVIK